MRSLAHLTTALMLSVGLCPTPTSAQDYAQADEPSWAHLEALVYARTYTMLGYSPASNGLPAQDLALVVERARAVGELSLGEYIFTELAWDLLPLIGASTTLGALATPTGSALRLVDFDGVLYSPSNQQWLLRHNLDRLVVRIGSPRFQVSLGRQALSHGSARMFPASDFFAPFAPGTIDTEFKRGVDALRVTAPINDTQELEAIAVANGTDAAQGLYLLRWRKSFEQRLDISILAGSTYAQPTLAIDVAGDVLGASWYTEGSARLSLNDDEQTSVRATAGLNYQLELGLNVIVEGHYSSPGGAAPYAVQLARQARGDQREVIFLGPWYGGLALGYTLTPLTQVSAGYIQNLTDGSGLLTVALGYDFAQEVTLGLGLLAPIGARPSLTASGVRLNSEFGAYPLLAFSDLRLVF